MLKMLPKTTLNQIEFFTKELYLCTHLFVLWWLLPPHMLGCTEILSCYACFFVSQFLEQYGEVSMLDIKGAEAAKVVLVIGIMTLHSFGEGAGVGVSFAGSKGFSQGILVTLAIAVHNIPEGLAVSMMLASRGVSPQNAMLWSVITSLPQVVFYAW